MEWFKSLDSFMILFYSLPLLALACGLGLMFLEWKYPTEDSASQDVQSSPKMLL